MMPDAVVPPDGGCRAIIVVIGSFLCNGLIFGLINSYSVLNVHIVEIFKGKHVENALSKASLIGSLTIGTTFLLSMVSGIVSDRIGIRLTTFIGGFIVSSNVLAASFFIENVYLLMLTYGVLFGVGASLTYIPSLSIIGHYFKRNIGIANGFVTVGSSVFSVAMPYILGFLIDTFDVRGCLRAMGLMLSMLMVCSLAFKPLYKSPVNEKDSSHDSKKKSLQSNSSIWRNKKYIIWLVAVPTTLSGYLVPYVHMGKFMEDAFPRDDGKLPITSIALTSGIGRLFFGFLSDRKHINSIVLQQISFLVIGIVSILVPLTKSYTQLVCLNLFLGLFDGCFVSLIGPIAVKLCGPKEAGRAIGFLLGFSSLPMIAGPPIAGWLRDQFHSYTVPFIVAGIPPILGAIILTLVHIIKTDSENSKYAESSKLTECNPLTEV